MSIELNDSKIKYRLSGRKYGHWFIFVAIFSAIPIFLNIFLDYVSDRNGFFEWRGVRLMDFLTCGFCLIGGAFCDRYNANKAPSGLACAASVAVCSVALALYIFVKYSYASQDALNYYPHDNQLVLLIMGSYASSLLISAIMLRKTLRENIVLDKERKIKKFTLKLVSFLYK